MTSPPWTAHTIGNVGRGMPSSLLDGKHSRTTSGMACHHRLWAAQTVGRRRALHAIIALGRQKGQTTSGVTCHYRLWTAHTVERRRVWHCMPSSPFASIHSRTTLRVACHHRLWAAYTVERRQACRAMITFGIADKVGRRRAWHAIIALGRETRSNEVGRGMQSSPLGSTDSRTTSGVACHHRPWTANMVERRWAWHAIIAFGQHRQSNGVGRGMPSSPLGSTDGRTTSGVACHHRLWKAHTVERCRAWHAIMAF